jgi:hypothetical protein
MGRGLAGRPVGCDVHPHRPATDRCDDCRGRFCGACLVRAGETLRCRACTDSLPVREAAAAEGRRLGPRLRQALRERLGGLVAAAVLAGVLGGAFALALWGGRSGAPGAGTALSQALADEPAVRQRLLAARYCAGGPGTTGELPGPRADTPDLTSPTRRAPDTGAAIVQAAAVLPDTLLRDDRLASTPLAVDPYDPLNLTRDRTADGTGWRSRTALFPQQVGFALRGTVEVDRVAFRHTRAAPPATWAREVGLWLSTAGPETGFSNVGRWTLAPTTAPHEFVFFETFARYARVCLYASHGSSESVSLGSFVLAPKGGTTPLLPP